MDLTEPTLGCQTKPVNKAQTTPACNYAHQPSKTTGTEKQKRTKGTCQQHKSKKKKTAKQKHNKNRHNTNTGPLLTPTLPISSVARGKVPGPRGPGKLLAAGRSFKARRPWVCWVPMWGPLLAKGEPKETQKAIGGVPCFSLFPTLQP